jgi:hypothetical protein
MSSTPVAEGYRRVRWIYNPDVSRMGTVEDMPLAQAASLVVENRVAYLPDDDDTEPTVPARHAAPDDDTEPEGTPEPEPESEPGPEPHGGLAAAMPSGEPWRGGE